MLRAVVVLCLVAAAVAGPPVTRRRGEIEEFRNFLESTRTENGVRVNANPQYGNKWENSGKFQGDILLDDEQVEELMEQFSTGRAAYIRPNTRWPGGIIPYEFAAGHFDLNQTNYILNAMRALESRTCIRFRPRHAGEFNYALITGHADGCYASVGYSATRGVRTMNVAVRGCLHFVVIIHEWLHVIGFFHMQSANSRNNYVKINWQNIEKGMRHNFYRYLPNVVSDLGVPYEYTSCMHYTSHAFSRNGRSTMDALRPHDGVMGQLDYVTGYDLLRVDRHYGCAPWRTEKDYKPLYEQEFLETKEEVSELDSVAKANEASNTKEIPKVVEEVPETNDVDEVSEITKT